MKRQRARVQYKRKRGRGVLWDAAKLAGLYGAYKGVKGLASAGYNKFIKPGIRTQKINTQFNNLKDTLNSANPQELRIRKGTESIGKWNNKINNVLNKAISDQPLKPNGEFVNPNEVKDLASKMNPFYNQGLKQFKTSKYTDMFDKLNKIKFGRGVPKTLKRL
jgi:hypothetical protein